MAPSDRTQVFWSATLTVDAGGTAFGCQNESRTIDHCSSTAALTDDDFTFRGATYTLTEIVWLNDFKRVYLEFAGLSGAEAKAALSGLTLNVDGRRFAINHARVRNQSLSWPASPSWTDGQKVSLSLGYFDRPEAPWA